MLLCYRASFLKLLVEVIHLHTYKHPFLQHVWTSSSLTHRRHPFGISYFSFSSFDGSGHQGTVSPPTSKTYAKWLDAKNADRDLDEQEARATERFLTRYARNVGSGISSVTLGDVACSLECRRRVGGHI